MDERLIRYKNKIYLKFRYHFINNIFTHLTSEEKIALLSLAKSSQGIFVEIGSFLGSSSCFISEGIIKSGKNSKLFCVDTWENDAMSEGNRNTYAEFISNTKKYSKIHA